MSETEAPPTISPVTAYVKREARRLVKVDQLTAAMETIRGERDAAVARADKLEAAADSGVLQKRVKEVEQQLRDYHHRSAFDKAARTAGISDDKLDAAWKLSDHKSEGEPTDEAITSTLDGLKSSSAFLFAAPTAKDDGTPPPKPAPGSGNGGSPQRKPTGDVIIPEDDQRWSDPVWQMNNQDRIIAHYTERKARGEI